MRVLICFLCMLGLFQISYGQTSTPSYSNEFLSIGVGARSFAMGNASVASQSNAEGIYWNPASLVEIDKKFDASIMHAEYFGGLSAYDFAGIAIQLNPESAIGFGLIRYGVDDIPNTLELMDSDGNLRYDRITNFSAADYALLISYSRKTKIKGLNLGGNVKIIYRHTGDFASAYGFGIDLAASYKTSNWKFAAMLRDASSTFNAWVFKTDNLEEVFQITGNEIPENSTELTLPKLILGINRNFHLSDKFNLLAELNTDITFDGKRNVLIQGDPISIDPHFGLETAFKNFIFLRAGFNNLQKESNFDNQTEWTFQPNLGLGIHYHNFKLDYALTDVGDQSISKYSNVFSFSYAFQ